jgi:hypothetical protein
MLTAKRDEIMILLKILGLAAHLFAIAVMGGICYRLGRCQERLNQSRERLDEIRARIKRNKKSTEDAYRLIEEMREDERQ